MFFFVSSRISEISFKLILELDEIENHNLLSGILNFGKQACFIKLEALAISSIVTSLFTSLMEQQTIKIPSVSNFIRVIFSFERAQKNWWKLRENTRLLYKLNDEITEFSDENLIDTLSALSWGCIVVIWTFYRGKNCRFHLLNLCQIPFGFLGSFLFEI